MANVIRICLDDNCDCTTRFDVCTQPEHYQTFHGRKEYPVMSQTELEKSVRRLERLGWPGLERTIKRRRAKIRRLIDIRNGDN